MNRIAIVAFVIATLVIPAGAQLSVFDVASIRPTVETNAGPSFSAGLGGRLHIVSNPLMNVIANAYGVPPYRVAGEPNWVTSDRYDIEAKGEGTSSRDQMMSMLQALLEDRFKLRVHRESRQGAVYFLKTARDGHKLQASIDGSCVPFDPKNLSPSEPRRRTCGNNLMSDRGAFTAWRETRIEMAGVADALSRELRRPIIDQTGLHGFYDISVDLPPLDPAASTVRDTGDGGGPSFFTVLREQLGLTLESGRGPVDMLVIDHIERPTEN